MIAASDLAFTCVVCIGLGATKEQSQIDAPIGKPWLEPELVCSMEQLTVMRVITTNRSEGE